MHTFLVALVVIIGVAFVTFVAIKLYKYETARTKAVQARRAALRTETDTLWDSIEQNFQTNATNWGQIHKGIAEMQTQAEKLARIKQ